MHISEQDRPLPNLGSKETGNFSGIEHRKNHLKGYHQRQTCKPKTQQIKRNLIITYGCLSDNLCFAIPEKQLKQDGQVSCREPHTASRWFADHRSVELVHSTPKSKILCQPYQLPELCLLSQGSSLLITAKKLVSLLLYPIFFCHLNLPHSHFTKCYLKVSSTPCNVLRIIQKCNKDRLPLNHFIKLARKHLLQSRFIILSILHLVPEDTKATSQSPLTFISLWCIGSCNNVDVSTIHHNLIGCLLHLKKTNAPSLLGLLFNIKSNKKLISMT